jgi:transcriptional regulator with XRE-family HTH domain
MATVSTKAAVALRRIVMTQPEKAVRLGVSAFTVHRWETGATRPPKDLREKVRAVFGIPIEAWELLPSEPDPPGMPMAPAPDDDPILDDEELGAEAQTIDGRVSEVERALRTLMSEVAKSEGSARERANVLETVTRTLGQIARMRGTYELGARLFKLPVYRRLRTALLDALKPYPEAMTAVADALEKVAAEYQR